MIPTHLVLRRGDTRDVTLTLPSGATLLTSEVRLTARDDRDRVVWALSDADGIAVASDTVASAAITEALWDAWAAAGSPREMAFDWEVRPSGSVVSTPGSGTIRVVMDVTR